MIIANHYEHGIFSGPGGRWWLDRSRQRLVRFVGEEIVRYRVVMTLTEDYGYPASWIHTEGTVHGGGRQRPDVVVRPPGATCALVVVECKKRGTALKNAHEDQLFGYCESERAAYAVLTNGTTTKVWQILEGSRVRADEIPGFAELRAADVETVMSAFSGSGTQSESPAISAERMAVNGALAQRVHALITADAELFAAGVACQQYRVVEDLGVGVRSLGRIRGCWWSGGYRSMLLSDGTGRARIVRFKVGSGESDSSEYLYVVVARGTRNYCVRAYCLDDPDQAAALQERMRATAIEFLVGVAAEALDRKDDDRAVRRERQPRGTRPGRPRI